jgi:dethiobiotin synthetase
MPARILFITANDTGAGKTVFAAALTRHLRGQGSGVVALKPLCSGGRSDARMLHQAAARVLPLDDVNPWHFRAPVAPLVAARMEKRRVNAAQVLTHIRAVARRFEWVVVEGAGGLLSPMGEDFNSRDLIAAAGATPIVVCSNRLGVVNQALLVLEALPRKAARQAQFILRADDSRDASVRTNLALLAEFAGSERVHDFPLVRQDRGKTAADKRVREALERIVAAFRHAPQKR